MLSDLEVWLQVQDSFNDYETAFNHYQKEFKHVLMLSYDELFGAPEATAAILSVFLELEISLPKYKKVIETKVNMIEETTEVSEETYALLQERYAASQAYLDKIFGKDVCRA